MNDALLDMCRVNFVLLKSVAFARAFCFFFMAFQL